MILMSSRDLYLSLSVCTRRSCVDVFHPISNMKYKYLEISYVIAVCSSFIGTAIFKAVIISMLLWHSTDPSDFAEHVISIWSVLALCRVTTAMCFHSEAWSDCNSPPLQRPPWQPTSGNLENLASQLFGDVISLHSIRDAPCWLQWVVASSKDKDTPPASISTWQGREICRCKSTLKSLWLLEG